MKGNSRNRIIFLISKSHQPTPKPKKPSSHFPTYFQNLLYRQETLDFHIGRLLYFAIFSPLENNGTEAFFIVMCHELFLGRAAVHFMAFLAFLPFTIMRLHASKNALLYFEAKMAKILPSQPAILLKGSPKECLRTFWVGESFWIKKVGFSLLRSRPMIAPLASS